MDNSDERKALLLFKSSKVLSSGYNHFSEVMAAENKSMITFVNVIKFRVAILR
jgi:hypothetical protein